MRPFPSRKKPQSFSSLNRNTWMSSVSLCSSDVTVPFPLPGVCPVTLPASEHRYRAPNHFLAAVTGERPGLAGRLGYRHSDRHCRFLTTYDSSDRSGPVGSVVSLSQPYLLPSSSFPPPLSSPSTTERNDPHYGHYQPFQTQLALQFRSVQQCRC